jgi:uncharacterized protein YeaC (DUF1315 family)
MRVTAENLERLYACPEQVAIMRSEWPDGVEVTKESLLRAMALGLDLNWWAQHALPAPLRRAYEEALAPLQRAYEEAVAPLRRAYEEAKAPLRRAYEEAEAPLWRAYEEAKAPLWRAYEEAKAEALAKIVAKG